VVGRVHSAVVLKFLVAPIVALLGAGVLIGKTWLVVACFVMLILTLRAQRRQEIKRLYGYRRKRRKRRRSSASANAPVPEDH
jgi:hypothetical protein